uniref:PTB domain-containing engulfment adapter protein 1-like n=1 Tax=Seriola lalandi dorsalis TaxID=1841481 RepID=A0A3B4XP01_SERLL
MSDTSEDDNEITFQVKFLGRVEVVRPDGLQILDEAAQRLKTPDEYVPEKTAKKSKVDLFLSLSGIDILENKTKFLLYTCPLSTVSFCALLPSSTKVFGFVARHPAADMNNCMIYSSKKEKSIRGGRDLIVEALRHKNKMLQRENSELKRRLEGQTD